MEDEEELAYRALLYANEQDKLKKAKEAEKKEKLKVIREATMHFGKPLQKPIAPPRQDKPKDVHISPRRVIEKEKINLNIPQV